MPAPETSHPPRRRRWRIEEVKELGATTDLITAAEILGVGRSTAYTLARAGEFPAPVIRAGARYIVPVPALLSLLRAEPESGTGQDSTAGGSRLDRSRGAYVHGRTAQPADYPDAGDRTGDSDKDGVE